MYKTSQIADQSCSYIAFKSSKHSKFYYVGKTEEEYSGYSAQGSSVEKEFVSYLLDRFSREITNSGDLDLDTSTNLFELFKSESCQLTIKKHRLKNLHVNLLPTPADRLESLSFERVHFESFDSDLLASCVNLKCLELSVTFSKLVKFDFGFLRALTKLEKLALTLLDSTWDFSELKSLPKLDTLTLCSCAASFVEPLPKLTRSALEQILMASHLTYLKLYNLDIEAIEKKLLSRCRRLSRIELISCQIGRIDQNAFEGLSSSKKFSTVSIVNCEVNSDWDVFGGQNHIFSLSLENTGVRLLNENTLEGFKNLIYLSLIENSIDELPPYVFGSMKRLESLDLRKNRIRTVGCDAFTGLDHLEYLHMDENPIKKIEANAFAWLENLWFLSLNKCRLKSIDNKMFNEIFILNSLDLKGNLIERIEMVAENGRRINVAQAYLTEEDRELVEKHLFEGISDLKSLDLSENKLEKFNLSCLSSLEQLEDLNLSSNKISELSGRVDQMLTLRNLDLSRNLLESIEPDALPTSLRELNLTRNNLSRLGDDFLEKFKSSCCMDKPLSAKLCKLTRTDIVSLRNSDQLDFSDNFIETLDDPELFSSLQQKDTQSINLSCNRLDRIHRDIFKCLPQLESIDLSGNRLCSIDLGLFRHLSTYLKHLNLSSNRILYLNLARLFRICPRLQSLDLANNELDDQSTVEWIDPTTCCCMWKFMLAGNRLEKMDFVRDMTDLSSLDLRGNRIESLILDGYNLLGRLTKLCYLDLSGNRISLLRDEMFAHLRGQLKHLDLSGNPHNFKLDSVLSEIL